MIKEPNQWERALEVFFKILLPALVGVSIKVAIKMQREKITYIGVFLSYIIGIGSAWLASPLIIGAVNKEYVPMMIAIVAITGEKVGEWIIYKFNVDNIMNVLLSQLQSFVVGCFTKSNKNE